MPIGDSTLLSLGQQQWAGGGPGATMLDRWGAESSLMAGTHRLPIAMQYAMDRPAGFGGATIYDVADGVATARGREGNAEDQLRQMAQQRLIQAMRGGLMLNPHEAHVLGSLAQPKMQRDPMEVFRDPDLYRRYRQATSVSSGIPLNPADLDSETAQLFPEWRGSPSRLSQPGGDPSISAAAAGVQSSVANPLLQALRITPDTAAGSIEGIIKSRMSPGSKAPLSADELQQLANHAKNMRAINPRWASGIHSNGYRNLSELLKMSPGQDPMAAIRAAQQRAQEEIDLMNERNAYMSGF